MSASVSWKTDLSVGVWLNADRELRWTFPVEIVDGDFLANSVVNPGGLYKWLM